jgi:GntR family transcriptional regulator
VNIVISPASGKPIYQQLYEQLSAQILSGELKSGECLPPIRTVALELRISVITVKKAWEELESNGLIHSITGKGCFVAELDGAALEQKRGALAEDKLKKDIAYYSSLGLSKEELIELIKRSGV